MLPAKVVICTLLEVGFHMKGPNGGYRGYDRAVWDQVLPGVEKEIKLLGGYQEVLVRTRNKECDIGWSPLFVTYSREMCDSACKNISSEYLNADGTIVSPFPPQLAGTGNDCCLDFSSEYVLNGLSIMYKVAPKPPRLPTRARIGGLFQSVELANTIAFVTLIIIMIGHLMWLSERGSSTDDEWPEAYKDGIDDGVWWAAVTVTTVGYGDIFPRTGTGRLIGLVWMFAGLIVCGFFTSTVGVVMDDLDAKALADGQQEIRILDDVSDGKTVCTYGVTSKTVPSTMMVKVAPSFNKCLEYLESGDVDMIYMDSTIMASALKTKEKGSFLDKTNIAISPMTELWTTAIIFPEGSPLRSPVSAFIMKVTTSTDGKNIQEQWFPNMLSGTVAAQGDERPGEEPDWAVIVACFVLVGSYVIWQSAAKVRRKFHQRKNKQRPAEKPPQAPLLSRLAEGIKYHFFFGEAHTEEVVAEYGHQSTMTALGRLNDKVDAMLPLEKKVDRLLARPPPEALALLELEDAKKDVATLRQNVWLDKEMVGSEV